MVNKKECLGKVVREAWVEWAKTQPNPKPSWLVGWDDLPETDKEADRYIGYKVQAYLNTINKEVGKDE